MPKSCCVANEEKDKSCSRALDAKVFKLPRKYSRSFCLSPKNKKGYTQRSSCAPFQGCIQTGGTRSKEKNMKNLPLEVCSKNPLTGFYRDGYCKTGLNDIGVHTVCATMDERFLNFTYKKGNNLYGVAKVGDNWCLCEQRWYEAYKQGIAPHVIH